MKTYIIGDVHGEYKTLLKLIESIPGKYNNNFIFVGDLIDRGLDSNKVVKLVRDNNYKCVLGNHEDFMITYGESFAKTYPKSTNPNFLCTWWGNGGDTTLKSYDIIEYTKDGIKCHENEIQFKQFEEDVQWMNNLPLFLELDFKINDLSVVVSHASIGDKWHMHNDKNFKNTFKDYCLWHRINPIKEKSKIFNIFGHTIVDFGPDIQDHYINLDTGCYLNRYGYNKLSSYCLEDNSIISIDRVK